MEELKSVKQRELCYDFDGPVGRPRPGQIKGYRGRGLLHRNNQEKGRPKAKEKEKEKESGAHECHTDLYFSCCGRLFSRQSKHRVGKLVAR